MILERFKQYNFCLAVSVLALICCGSIVTRDCMWQSEMQLPEPAPVLSGTTPAVNPRTTPAEVTLNGTRTRRRRCRPAQRQEALTSYCNARPPSNRGSLAYLYTEIIVDDHHQVLYCFVPKVACSSFKTFLLMNSPRYVSTTEETVDVHDSEKMATFGLPFLESFPPSGRRRRLRSYFKFIVVRHPFDRLYSAYSNKFNNPRHEGLTEEFSDFLRSNFNITRIREQHITLQQFAESVAAKRGDFDDDHWRSVMDLCAPCRVQYDYILKLETLEEDLPVILKRYDENIKLPFSNRSRKERRNSEGEAITQYANISRETQLKLLELYKDDFDLFGYHWHHPVKEGEDLCYYDNSDGQRCC